MRLLTEIHIVDSKKYITHAKHSTPVLYDVLRSHCLSSIGYICFPVNYLMAIWIYPKTHLRLRTPRFVAFLDHAHTLLHISYRFDPIAACVFGQQNSANGPKPSGKFLYRHIIPVEACV